MNKIRNFENHHPHIEKNVYIDDRALVVGEVSIGEESSIWPNAVVRGDVNFIRIGKGSNVQDGTTIHVTHKYPENPEGFPSIIEDYVTIGHHAVIHGCHIESYSLIGIGAIILDGAHIEDHVLVAAGSLVPPGKRLEKGFLWMGSPVKKIRALTDAEMQHFTYSAKHYMKLKDKYRTYDK